MKQPVTPKFIIYYALKVKRSRIDGMGAYTPVNITKRRKIGSLGGNIISKKEAAKIIKCLQGESIAMVELWNGKVMDATGNSNELKYVNHSCSPNTYMRVNGYHVEFYSLREIKAGEELSCDYGETHHAGKKPCTCGSAQCRGFI